MGSRRRGFEVRDRLAVLFREVFAALAACVRDGGSRAALELLAELEGMPATIAEAMSGCEGPRPLTGVEVAEVLAGAEIPLSRHRLGRAVQCFGGQPCALLVKDDGSFEAQGGEADAEELLAAAPDIRAVVVFRRDGFRIALRRPAQTF